MSRAARKAYDQPVAIHQLGVNSIKTCFRTGDGGLVIVGSDERWSPKNTRRPVVQVKPIVMHGDNPEPHQQPPSPLVVYQSTDNLLLAYWCVARWCSVRVCFGPTAQAFTPSCFPVAAMVATANANGSFPEMLDRAIAASNAAREARLIEAQVAKPNGHHPSPTEVSMSATIFKGTDGPSLNFL